MIKSKTLISAWATLVCIAGLASMNTVYASAETTAEPHDATEARQGESYLPTDALVRIAAAKESAIQDNKLVLVVMGANWCHDSRALAARLETAPLNDIINQHYETVFVDVGHLNKGKDAIQSLGLPVYYATPTVLVVDPVSGRIVNADNRHLWGNAANISMEESVSYFEGFAGTQLFASQVSDNSPAELKTLLADIEAFEATQAERLYAAYAVLTPMLEAFAQGDKSKFSQATWDEVRQYRFRLAQDIDALRLDARRKVSAGVTDIELNYPTYPAFSWE